MTTIIETLNDDSKSELIWDQIIELVTVAVRAEPDPDRPEDRLALKIVAEITNNFTRGWPSIDTGLARVREVCGTSGNDLSPAMKDALLVALNRQRTVVDELHEGKSNGQPMTYLSDPATREFLTPILAAQRPEVTLWCASWTAAMDDDGMLVLGFEDGISTPDSVVAVKNLYDGSIYDEDRDGSTREKVVERIWRVNEVVGEMLREFMGVRF
jgi:hypothetical protein